MTEPPTQGTAARVIGIPEPSKTSRSKQPDKQTPGDRWALLNTIVDRLGWMPHPEHRVLLVLFRHADAGRKAWPGGTRIGNACGFSARRANKVLLQLERWGVIVNVRRGHKGSRKAAGWRICDPSDWPTEKPQD